MTPRCGCGSDAARWLGVVPDAILVVSDAVVVYANEAAQQLFAPRSAQPLTGELASRLLSHPALESCPSSAAFRLDGSRFEASVVSTPTTSNGGSATLHTVREVTRNTLGPRQQEIQDRLLRELPGRLIHEQEHERRHIALELHEEIAQCLSAIRVQFAKLQRRVEEPDALALIESASRMTDRTLGRVRSLSLLLHPPQLQTLGLAAALRWLLEEQERLHGLQFDFDSAPFTAPVDPDLAIATFRIVQEAVANAMRHGAAGHVTVALGETDAALTVSITDDGCGFDTRELEGEGREALGLLSMIERARLVGGELTIDTAPGAGTRIAARLPMRPHTAP